jgi:hypothetical protein
MVLADSGLFRITKPSPHTTTNAEVIQRFLPVSTIPDHLVDACSTPEATGRATKYTKHTKNERLTKKTPRNRHGGASGESDCNTENCFVGAESRRQRIRSWK